MQVVSRCFSIAFLAATAVLAQYTNQQISGIVRDASGASVATAKVTVRQTGTGLTREAQVTESGFYIVANVPIGEYEITAEAQGFKRFQTTGVIVTVNSKPTVDITLEIGTLTESVTVTADAASVEASTGEVGRLVTGEQATKLQLNGRNFAQLLALLPGVSTTNRSSFDLFGGFGSNMSAQSVNGGRTYTLSWNIDGADNKDNGGGGNNFVNINPDAIAEFKVLTSNYSAEFGQNAGAVVNLALRSGSKEFHGVLYELVRNDAFDARAYNALRKQKLRFNNFGGNIGGPILLPGGFNKDRDKLFFFAGVEFKRLRQGNPQTWNVPNLAQRNGDFSALAAGQQPRDVLNSNTPFPGGIVPSSRFSRNSKRLVDNYPAPNFTGAGGNFVFEPPTPLNANQYILKGDYLINSRHQLAIHYLRDYYTSLQNVTNLVNFNRNIPGTNTSAKWTFVAGPSTVNTLQFTFTGNVILQTNFQPNPIFVKDFTRTGLGINYPMVYGNINAIPSLNITGVNGLGVQPLNWNNFNRIFQFKDDFSKILGAHNLKFGALIMRSRKNQDNQPAINGSVSYSPGHPLHSGNPMADALLGNFNTYTEASSGREGWFRFSQAELYIADNWKVNRRLTLDLGARYQFMQPQYGALQNAVVFAPRFFDPSKVPTVFRNSGELVPRTGDAVNGLVAGGTGLPDFARIRIPNAGDAEVQRIYRGLPKEISPWDYNTFGPRIGLALDVTGRQQTVLRGGYGLFFERIQGNFVFGRVNNPPFIQESSIFSANLESPSGGTQRLFPSNLSSYDIDLRVPKVQNYSFGIQHKVFSDTLIDVAYVGSSGWHQYRNVNLNQLPTGTLQRNPGVNLNALRPYLGYANINHNVTASNFNYNSLQTQIKKQFRGGGLISMAYTWSKVITDASDWNEGPMDSYNFKNERGLATYDRRHIFVLSYIYPIPFWQKQDLWYKKALGGWQLSGITTLQSGRPLNITIQGDVAGTGTGAQRPNVIADPYLDAGTARRWFNPQAFVNPSAGTFGALGRNAITGPGTNNWDVSLQKIFAVNERIRAEFRAEVYNTPHHFSFFGVASTVGASNFGQITSANDPRTLQLGLRVSF